MTAKQSLTNKRPNNKKYHNKNLRFLFTVIILIAFALIFWRVFSYKTVDERIAAIEDSLAIPDSENAAFFYEKIPSYINSSLLTFNFSDAKIDDLTREELWTSNDYPELASWLDKQKDLIDDLIGISKIEQCRFSITDSLNSSDLLSRRLATMRKWAYLILRSANNDAAEGRLDEALDKYICIIRMGRHNIQQPIGVDFLVGIALESLALEKIRLLSMHDDITEEHLKTIENILPEKNFDSNQHWKTLLEVEKLYSLKFPDTSLTPEIFDRFKEWWLARNNLETTLNRVHEIYLRLLAERRGNQIVLALRRHKDRTGFWPEKLDQLKYIPDENILIDPQNNKPFIYKPIDDDFILYSTGINNIDENGRERGGADDRPIWPKQIPQLNSNPDTNEEPAR